MLPTTRLWSPTASSTTSSTCMFSTRMSSDCCSSPRNLVSRDFKLPSGLQITSMISYCKISKKNMFMSVLPPLAINSSFNEAPSKEFFFIIENSPPPSSAYKCLYTGYHSPLPTFQQCCCLTWLNRDFATSFKDSKSLCLRYL